ncbi:MAG: ATP-binding protein [Eubacteriales bacterium]|jgi:DNA replication protein DnaC
MALTNEQYDAVMRIYSERQLKNRRITEEHRAEAFRAVPRLREIDEEIADAGIRRARYLLTKGQGASPADGSADVQEDSDLEKIISRLREERKTLLLLNGFPENYLEPVYDCPYCHDTGYVGTDKCSCFKKLELSLLYKDSSLGQILGRENFDTFRLDFYSSSDPDPRSGKTARQEAEEALRAAREFCSRFPSNENLMIYGAVGVGKTFLTHCIAKSLIDRAFSVIYMTAYELTEKLGQYKFSPGSDGGTGTDGRELKQIHDNIFSCDLLIIDDLGAELVNSFVSSEFFLIVNERIKDRKSTIISTNLSLGNFQNIFSERTFSRIMGSYRLIHMSGRDIRIQKKLGGNEND